MRLHWTPELIDRVHHLGKVHTRKQVADILGCSIDVLYTATKLHRFAFVPTPKAVRLEPVRGGHIPGLSAELCAEIEAAKREAPHVPPYRSRIGI
jgi:hypothetical protein